MFKDMNKLEKAGLVIGAIECIAGFGIAIYHWNKLVKMADNVIENIEDTTPNLDNIDFSIPTQNIDVLMNKED